MDSELKKDFRRGAKEPFKEDIDRMQVKPTVIIDQTSTTSKWKGWNYELMNDSPLGP
jgi:hypothetical protein